MGSDAGGARPRSAASAPAVFSRDLFRGIAIGVLLSAVVAVCLSIVLKHQTGSFYTPLNTAADQWSVAGFGSSVGSDGGVSGSTSHDDTSRSGGGDSGSDGAASGTTAVESAEAESDPTAADDDACSWLPPRVTAPEGNPLWSIFQAHKKGPLMRKWSPYFDVYARYFQRYRGKPLTFLEIGVQSGGSIGMWQAYFGQEHLTYHGADINPYCKELFAAPPRVNIHIGDQGSRAFWQKMRALNVTYDIILDDGGHTMQQQIVTFEEAWPMLADGGTYICEDTSTSMDNIDGRDSASIARYGGGYGKASTWISYAKQFADIVNGHYVNKTAHPQFDSLGRSGSVLSAAFYDQMVVLEKGPHPLATPVSAGNFMIPIGGDLKNGVIDPDRLAAYKQKLAASLA